MTTTTQSFDGILCRKMLGRKVYWTWVCEECKEQGTMFDRRMYAQAVYDAHREGHQDLKALAKIYGYSGA